MTKITDRELLELAAKAAGIAVSYIGPQGVYSRKTDCNVWDPLTDDGDALRLAVKLGIGLEFVQGVLVIAGFRRNHEDRRDHNDDLNTATRRAIVRAAAEIGKGMK